MYTNQNDKNYNSTYPYIPVKKECMNEQCFCTGVCNEIVSYRHVNTGVIISVHDYNEEFVFSKKHKLWNPNGVDSGDIDGGRL